eukprot:TRINITY_DN78152_c0_g1_i1.p1 TRINITY_DN78152_c0_g1~~TRINITY_DN78152_c0_g1_i1.p1  ORF type:complete len:252 (-),score=32.88 TRINITY_DN78152_c0_g1_i1:39-794(-)
MKKGLAVALIPDEGPEGNPNSDLEESVEAMLVPRISTLLTPPGAPPTPSPRTPECLCRYAIDVHPDLGNIPELDLKVLSQRVARHTSAASADIQALMLEYARYLELKMSLADFADNKLAAPSNVQMVWCLHLQDFSSYLKDCAMVKALVSWKRHSQAWLSIPADVRKSLVQMPSELRQRLARMTSQQRSALPRADVTQNQKGLWILGNLKPEQVCCLQKLEPNSLQDFGVWEGNHPCGVANIDAGPNLLAA